MQNEHVEFDAFLSSLRAVDKEQVLRNISWQVGRLTNADMTWIAAQLLANETRETSGIGDGVAIPHLKSTPLSRPFVIVTRLAAPVAFGAVDGQDVNLVCAILSPQMDGPLHLQRLSRVTRIFRDPSVLARLHAASGEAEMAAILRPENRFLDAA